MCKLIDSDLILFIALAVMHGYTVKRENDISLQVRVYKGKDKYLISPYCMERGGPEKWCAGRVDSYKVYAVWTEGPNPISEMNVGDSITLQEQA